MMYKLRIIDDLGFEVWQDIPGYEGLYQVSTYGRVKGLTCLLKPLPTNKGYVRVGLCKRNSIKYFSIHRLVAQAFIPNPSDKPEVNHINENKKDNFVSNLEWVTQSENQRHGTKLKRGVDTKINNGYIKRVLMLNLDGEFIMEFKSIPEAAKYIGHDKSNIWSCCNNKRDTAYGYKWAYV